MTMTATELTFWPTVWGKLRPGDLVQGDEHGPWELTAAITVDITEYCVVRAGVVAWVTQADGDPVVAARPQTLTDPFAENRALAVLLEAFGEIAPVTSKK